MCGIVGVVAKSSVNLTLVDALTLLQHRGQDAAGIVTNIDDNLYARKANGLVREVFRDKHMPKLKGNIGIGHVRYPTQGTDSEDEAQPFYVNSPYGIALAHNGNLTNAKELKRELFASDLRHLNTESDSEIILNVLAHELQQLRKISPTVDDYFYAVQQVFRRCHGAYAVIALVTNQGILAFRDPCGVRPLVLGKRETVLGNEYMLASESCALEALEFKIVSSLKAGEAVFISTEGEIHRKVCADNVNFAPCIFEYVYLARPDSIIDDVSVYNARLKMGENLGKYINEIWPDHDIDVVIPIPETSRSCAHPLARELKVDYRDGFVKNRYIARTFIMPGQKLRENSVRQKLNVLTQEFNGKNVLLVDDSIVRGTTSKKIVKMVRDAGAKKVYFASAAPEIRYQNVYGIDMPAKKDLIAHDKTASQVAKIIGADRVFYQRLDDLIKSVQFFNPTLKNFDCSIFTGNYVTDNLSDTYLSELSVSR